jgi:hypothetical protein
LSANREKVVSRVQLPISCPQFPARQFPEMVFLQETATSGFSTAVTLAGACTSEMWAATRPAR